MAYDYEHAAMLTHQAGICCSADRTRRTTVAPTPMTQARPGRPVQDCLADNQPWLPPPPPIVRLLVTPSPFPPSRTSAPLLVTLGLGFDHD